VCEVAAANSSSLLGQSFSFTERTADSVVGPFSVNAASKPDVSCGGLTRYRVGTRVSIAEAAVTGVQVSNVDVTGGSLSSWAGLDATAIVGPSNVTTVVNYTNEIVCGACGPGAIEVCVQAGDSTVNGTFNFQLSSGEWSTSVSVTLPSGSGVVCTGDIPVPPGHVTVTEESDPPYDVSAVAAIPTGDLVSEDLATQTATFTVTDQVATTAIFTDSTVTG